MSEELKPMSNERFNKIANGFVGTMVCDHYGSDSLEWVYELLLEVKRCRQFPFFNLTLLRDGGGWAEQITLVPDPPPEEAPNV